MYPSVYYVDKASGTIGDVLLAYGVTEWLSGLLPKGRGIGIRLSDRGGAFEIRLEGLDGIPEEWVTTAPQPDLLKYLGTPKTIEKCPPGVPLVDYQAEREQQAHYWEAFRQLSAEDRRRADEVLHEQGIKRPHPDLPVWILINTQKAISSYNKLVVTWYEHRDVYPRLADLMLRLFGAFPNPVEAIVEEWAALVQEAGLAISGQETAVQILNPQLAKGVNRPKAQKLLEQNLKSFWLLEFLRYVGLYRAGIPIMVQGSSDRKTYVPLPHEMIWSSTDRILRDYRAAMRASTAIKSDILAVLRYMNVYLTDWRDAQQDSEPLFAWAISQPGNHASGIAAVFYKDMGSAHAVLDMSVLKLPRWMPDPRDVADAEEYLALLREHQIIIASLEEARSDENTLLRTYRRFLTTGDLRVFFDFCAGLGALAMSLLNSNDARERRRARLFSLTTIERMIAMREDLSYYEIFQNEGFRRVAAAIRHATFYPQWNQSKGRETEYKPEYGLGQKLRQQAPYPDKFLAELAAFAQRYQAETLRKMEHPLVSAKGQARRPTLSEEDLADIAALVDQYGSEVVCELLVAAGYSWPRRYEAESEEASAEG